MAESAVSDSRVLQVPCRYFAVGICREGERCLYLHQEGNSRSSHPGDQNVNVNKLSAMNAAAEQGTMAENSSSSNKTSASSVASSASSTSTSSPNQGTIVCHYFLQGRCMYGAKCHYSHDVSSSREDSSSSEASSSSSCVGDSLNDQPSSSISSDPSTQTPEDDESIEETRMKDNSVMFVSKSTLRVPDAESWVNAPEFVPSGLAYQVFTDESIEPPEVEDVDQASSAKTWAQVVNASAGTGVPSAEVKLCPYAEMGECPYEDRCTYLHGDICELCGRACLHPTNKDQRKSHNEGCIKQHEREMELAFAVARSRDKQCGVCFEVVVEKNPASEQRFGILPNCNHCFCLACIRKWRQAKQFESKIIRACPECRVKSDYVCPSMYWVDTKEEKEKLILAYKGALSNKQCKYFKQGQGKCPFGNKCFYLHAYPDGTKVDTGPPIRRHRQNADGDLDMLQHLLLWDFLDERENRWFYSRDELEDIVAFLTDSEDSELSDYEIF